MGLIVILMCGAACFYLYMRIAFIERKGTMFEAVLVDIKVAIDSIMTDNNPSPVPISPPPVASNDPIPEESFYSSVLDQAHEEATESNVSEEVAVEKGTVHFEDEAPEADPELDTMTKNDLLALAEKRGLRAKKSSSRNEIITLLRRSNPLQNDSTKAGAENVSGSAGASFQNGASLDGSVHVDLGQGGAALE